MKTVKPVRFKSTLLINFVGIFLLATIPIILTVVIILSAYIKDVRSQYAESHGELLLKNQIAIDYQVDNLFAIPTHLLGTEEAVSFLQNGDAISSEETARLHVLLSGYRAGLDYVSSAVLFSRATDTLIDDAGKLLMPHADDQAIRQDFFEYSLSWYSEYRFYEHQDPFFTPTSTGTVWVCQPLHNSEEVAIGLLAFELDMTLLSESIQSQTNTDGVPKSRFYVLTDYNRVLYRSEQGNMVLQSVFNATPGETLFTTDGNTDIMVSVSEVNDYG